MHVYIDFVFLLKITLRSDVFDCVFDYRSIAVFVAMHLHCQRSR